MHSTLRPFFLLAGFCLMLLSGCGNSAVGCSDNGDCPDLQACIRSSAEAPGTCAPVDCVTSEQCELGNFCNSSYSCEPGCESALDCRAGENCDEGTNTCQAYGCRDTQLDCGYGQFCEGGQCIDASGQCELSCSTDDDCIGGVCLGSDRTGIACIGLPGECGSTAECYCMDADCFVTECLTNRCFASCTAETDCPRGFSCVNDPTIGSFCFADCEYVDQFRN